MYRFAHEKSRGRTNWSVMEAFNDWIREHDLDDISIANKNFTGWNKRRDPTLVKLDRVLVNAQWNLDFVNTVALALTATTSDHAPIAVDFNRDVTKSRLFHFESH